MPKGTPLSFSPMNKYTSNGGSIPNPLTNEKLFEIYGLYSLLIDLHISQVRPQNLDEFSYIPARFTQVESIRYNLN